MTKNKEFSVGDEVTSFLRRSSGDKISVRGTIKDIVGEYGRKTYILTKGVAEDFPTRTIKKLKK